MFSLGFGEILVICVILIIVVGPDKLPTVMRGVGKTMRTVREASREIRTTVGLDELMRDDPPRPVYRPPPPATVARAQSLPAETAPKTDAESSATPDDFDTKPTTVQAAVSPAAVPAAAPAGETAIAPATDTAVPPAGGGAALPRDPDKAAS